MCKALVNNNHEKLGFIQIDLIIIIEQLIKYFEHFNNIVEGFNYIKLLKQ